MDPTSGRSKLLCPDGNLKSISRKEFKPTIPVRRKRNSEIIGVKVNDDSSTSVQVTKKKEKVLKPPRARKEWVRATSGLFGSIATNVGDLSIDDSFLSSNRTAADLDEETYVDPFHQSSNALTPVTLPINPRIDSKSTLSVGGKGAESKTDEEAVSAGQVLYRSHDDESESTYVFHLPDVLPVDMSKLDLDPDETKVDDSTEPTIHTLPPGYLGRMRIHRSGKVTMLIGDISFDVDIHSKSAFLQELLCCQTESLDKGIVGNIGTIPYSLSLSPNYESLTS